MDYCRICLAVAVFGGIVGRSALSQTDSERNSGILAVVRQFGGAKISAGKCFPVFSVSQDGKLIAITSVEGREISVCELKDSNNSIRFSIGSRSNGIADLYFSPDGQRIVVSLVGGGVRVYDWRNKKLKFAIDATWYDFEIHQSTAVTTDFSLIAVAVSDKRVKRVQIHETMRGSIVHEIILPNRAEVRSLRFSEDKRALTGLCEGVGSWSVAFRWDIETGNMISKTSLEGYLASATHISLSNSGDLVAMAGTNATREGPERRISIINLKSGSVVRHLQSELEPNSTMRFSQDDRWILAQIRGSNSIDLVDLNNEKVDRLRGVYSPVTKIELSRTRDLIVCSTDCGLQFWQSDGKVYRSESENDAVWSFRESTDGLTLITTGVDGLRCWELRTGKQLWHREAIKCAIIDNSESEVLALKKPNILQQLHMHSGRVLSSRTLRPTDDDNRSPDEIAQIAASKWAMSKEQVIAYSVENSRQIGIIGDLTNKDRNISLDKKERVVGEIIFKHASKELVFMTVGLVKRDRLAPVGFGGTRAKVLTYDLLKNSFRVGPVVSGGYAVSFSRNGDKCGVAVFGADDPTRAELSIWQVNPARQLGVIRCRGWTHANDAGTLCPAPSTFSFSPDGSKLALAGSSGSVYLYDLQRFSQLCELHNAHTAPLSCVSFALDGKSVYTSTLDGRISILSITSAREREKVSGTVN